MFLMKHYYVAYLIINKVKQALQHQIPVHLTFLFILFFLSYQIRKAEDGQQFV